MSSARPPPHPGVDAAEELEADAPMPDPSSVMATVGVGIIQAIVFFYDFVTYPVYYAAQQPWKRVSEGHYNASSIIHFFDICRPRPYVITSFDLSRRA